MNLKTITPVFVALSAIAYFAAAFVWYTPLPTYERGFTEEEGFQFCNLHDFLTQNKRKHVRLERVSVQAGEYREFDDDGYVLVENNLEYEKFEIPCNFQIARIKGTEYWWNSSPPKGSNEEILSLHSIVGSTNYSTVSLNEAELLMSGVFFVKVISESLQPKIQLVKLDTLEDVDIALKCSSLVDVYGDFFGRILCPISLIGS